jgi:hypothetical protein
MTEPLKTFPTLRRGNYLLKISAIGSQFLIVASHLLDDQKFYIRHFAEPIPADDFIEHLIERDIYG